MKKHPITVARGDGIGPNIMQATLDILTAAGAALEIEEVEIGEKLYLAGHPTGITDETWESLQRTKVFLKAPITTPQGGGFRSLNVTVRTKLGLYANIRPCISYYPFIETKHPKMNVVIVRENEEDLYTGIEYRQTPDVCQALKIISRSGSERICRYAFEYARRYNRKKVTCFSKDNILKMSDGLFHQVFEEIATDYPDIENEHWIVDIGAARLADTPEAFDVVVLPNLYGDILSDVAAQITGSVGIAGSANIGVHGAMFEAIHGSAPRMQKEHANPSGLLLASVLMLVHIHQPKIATRIHNAWLKTLEEGVHTKDIFREGQSRKKVGTQEFAQAVIANLDKTPDTLPSVNYEAKKSEEWAHHGAKLIAPKRELVGVDIYLYSHENVEHIVASLQNEHLPLTLITNRGTEVWPEGLSSTFCTDHWRARFHSKEPISPLLVTTLITELAKKGLDVIKTENLYDFDGKPGYSHSR